jgi:hypothetical protein
MRQRQDRRPVRESLGAARSAAAHVLGPGGRYCAKNAPAGPARAAHAPEPMAGPGLREPDRGPGLSWALSGVVALLGVPLGQFYAGENDLLA